MSPYERDPGDNAVVVVLLAFSLMAVALMGLGVAFLIRLFW